MMPNISGSLIPQKRPTSSCSVIGYPQAVSASAWARLMIGSLSTSTPSQSKMTSLKQPAITGTAQRILRSTAHLATFEHPRR